MDRDASATTNNRPSTARRLATTLAVAGAAALLALLGIVVLRNADVDRAGGDAYARAEQLLENGDYMDAALAFEALGDYRDAADRASQAYGLRDEARYAHARELLEQGDYEQAARAFRSLGDFGDAREQGGAAERSWLAGRYEAADAAAGEGDHAHAASLFRELADYRDAAARADEEQWAAVRSDDLEGLEVHLGSRNGSDLVWMVASAEDGVATLVLADVIALPFEVVLPCDWDGCGVGSWLENDFVTESFSKQDAEKILDGGHGAVDLPTNDELLSYLGDAAWRHGIDWRLDPDGLLGGKASYIYVNATHYTYDRDLLERQVGIRPVVRVRI